MNVNYYPLKLELKGMYRPYMWGGRKLAKLVQAPENEPVAELWAVSDRPEEEKVSLTQNGPLTGKKLQQLIEHDPIGFLGFDTPGHRFPILVKILDAKQRLSVQAHPPAAVAKQLGGNPKAESWFFLDGCEPSAYVYAGFATGTTKDQFSAALTDGSAEQYLHRLNVRPGAMINTPNGRVHGVGEGCLILETQQNSNTTYRVFDYNRTDPKTSQTRPLHVEQALASLNFDDQEPDFEAPQPISDNRGARQLLLATDYFALERFTGTGLIEEATGGIATIVVNIAPNTHFSVSANSTTIEQNTFEFSLIPAAVDHFTIEGPNLDYILIRPVAPQSHGLLPR